MTDKSQSNRRFMGACFLIVVTADVSLINEFRTGLIWLRVRLSPQSTYWEDLRSAVAITWMAPTVQLYIGQWIQTCAPVTALICRCCFVAVVHLYSLVMRCPFLFFQRNAKTFWNKSFILVSRACFCELENGGLSQIHTRRAYDDWLNVVLSIERRLWLI